LQLRREVQVRRGTGELPNAAGRRLPGVRSGWHGASQPNHSPEPDCPRGRAAGSARATASNARCAASDSTLEQPGGHPGSRGSFATTARGARGCGSGNRRAATTAASNVCSSCDSNCYCARRRGTRAAAATSSGQGTAHSIGHNSTPSASSARRRRSVVVAFGILDASHAPDRVVVEAPFLDYV
jgi:hypothetical protein